MGNGRHIGGLVGLLAALTLGDACGGDSGEPAREPDTPAHTESTSGTAPGFETTAGDPSNPSTSTVGVDSDFATGASSSTGGANEGLDPCAAVELPARTGQELVVAPAGDGVVSMNGQTMTLRAAIAMAQPGDTVLLEDGSYTLPDADPGAFTGVYITTPDITVRGRSGDASAVIIDGAYRSMGSGASTVTIAAEGVTLAHVTVRRSIFHLVHIWADGDEALLYDLRLEDGGQQFLKASVNEGSVDDVEVACSSFAMTDEGRDNVWGYGPQDGFTTCYTGGIDTHNARNWSIHDNRFAGIYCDASGVRRPAHGRFAEQRDGMTYVGGLSEHAVHMWDSEDGTAHVVARNQVVDCARGIGIGLVAPVYGTLVVNNTVASTFAGAREHDVGISIMRGNDMVVAHNTVVYTHPDAYPDGIETRFAETSNVLLHGNLTNMAIRARDGAVAEEVGSSTRAELDWFVDAPSGDLHLVDCAVTVGVARHPAVVDDIDGVPRADPTTAGADGCD